MDDPDLRTIGLAYGLNCENYREAFDIFRTHHAHPDPVVRANVVLGLMHLCRRFERCDLRMVKPLVMHGLRDSAEIVRQNAETVVEDLRYRFKVRIGKR